MSGSAGKLSELRKLAGKMQRPSQQEVLRAEFARIVSEATHTTAGPLLLELVAEGTPLETVRKFLEWFAERADVDSASKSPELPSGHPFKVFQRESAALRSSVERLRTATSQLGRSEGALEDARNAHRDLAEIDSHFRRQEFLLFTRLESYGLVRPGRILWTFHDDIRQWLKYLQLKMASKEFDITGLGALKDTVIEPLLNDIENVIFLEDTLLLPMAWETLDESDWSVIWKHSPEIGWCLIEPGTEYTPSLSPQPRGGGKESGQLRLPGGTLDPGNLVEIHRQLPVDLTVIDAEDRLRYFSEGTRPVFYRSEAILGRNVECCHPPRSVHYVRQILSDFKAGLENSAQFWKQMGERFVHIRFVALRGPEGEYRGTLEVAQDITPLRALEGQQLELKYDRPARAAKR